MYADLDGDEAEPFDTSAGGLVLLVGVLVLTIAAVGLLVLTITAVVALSAIPSAVPGAAVVVGRGVALGLGGDPDTSCGEAKVRQRGRGGVLGCIGFLCVVILVVLGVVVDTVVSECRGGTATLPALGELEIGFGDFRDPVPACGGLKDGQ